MAYHTVNVDISLMSAMSEFIDCEVHLGSKTDLGPMTNLTKL